jgi:predicted O-linked N-acetylglucosamine transferase (SPINDLY family)
MDNSGVAPLQHGRQEREDVVAVLTAAEQHITSGRADLAMAAYQEWLKHADSPFAYVVLFNLGVAQTNAGNSAGAETSYRSALARKPDFIEPRLNLGTLLESQGRVQEALAQWRAVLALDDATLKANRPLHLQALNNLARLLELNRHLAEAEGYLAQSLALDPTQPHALQHWIHLRQKQCEWPMFKPLPGIAAETMRNHVSALAALSAFDDPVQLLRVSRRFTEEKVDRSLAPLCSPEGYDHDRLRIGYLSSDFCLHPVSLLMAEVFELHNRDKVEIFGFCWSREDGSALRRRVVNAFDHYIPIGHLSDEQAAQRIRMHEIDILVDLHGLTSGVRPGILARKPAPVQLTWLGYPGTTGMPCIDYVIADAFVLPETLAPHFSEQPLRLPHCFQASDRKRPIGPTPTRASCGLPEDAFVFCSFNNNYKFTPEMFRVWMNILHAVPDSVLWLLADNEWAQRNLQSEAQRQGIEASRLIFASRVAPEDYLARYRLADLFLDTTPFNAGTTANDALWMELPLLTCSGRTFSSRMAGSLLHTLGLDELITADLDEYERAAIRLARNRDEHAALRRKLRERRATSPLFDIPRLVADLENAFETIVVRPGSPRAAKDARKDTEASEEWIAERIAAIQMKLQHGSVTEARALCEAVLLRAPAEQAALSLLAVITQIEHINAARSRFPGPQYLDWMAWLHQALAPAHYLEIGSGTGHTLRLASSPTKAVGIDSELNITTPLRCWTKLFKMRADDFFAGADLHQVLDGQPIDLALISATHSFEETLRSFAHIERHAHTGTVIALCDVAPVTPITATRDRQSLFWLGDTWKAIPILKAARPDLRIVTIPAFPSGLTLISGLDPEARGFISQLPALISQWADAGLDEFASNLEQHLNMIANDWDEAKRALRL